MRNKIYDSYFLYCKYCYNFKLDKYISKTAWIVWYLLPILGDIVVQFALEEWIRYDQEILVEVVEVLKH